MRTLLLIVAALAAVSCTAHREPQVQHVVLMWMKTPGDAAAIDRVIRESHELRTIPGLVSVKAGRPIPSTRPVVDSSFDVGIVMTFKDEAALEAYETHPRHAQAVREVLRPLAAKFQIYDIRETEAGASAAPASSDKGNGNRTNAAPAVSTTR